MKHLRYILLFVGVLLCSHLFAQNVSNADFYQDGKNVVITYSLDKPASVTVQVSTDGGVTFSAPLKYVSGHVGKNVQAGENRIVWDVLSEYEKLVGEKFQFLIRAESNSHNGHEYVDLGLPSGILWATCNIGTSTPQGYGDYFAWGETSRKSTYDWNTYKHTIGNSSTLNKYCTDSHFGTVDNKKILNASDDAARVNWGGNWRIPTKAEQDELRTKCQWTWMSSKGVNGYNVKGPNGKSIFLPAAGYRSNSKFFVVGTVGCYWSSSLVVNSTPMACGLFFNSGTNNLISSDYRCYGLPIRPVCSSR